MGAVLSGIAHVNGFTPDMINQPGIIFAWNFGYFSMQMQILCRSGLLMQGIDILGNHLDFILCFEPDKRFMSGVRNGLESLFSPLVIKMQPQLFIGLPGPGRSYLTYVVVFPQAVRIAECFKTAVCTHSGT